MPPHDSEEYVLVVGASSKILAELDMAVFWPLSAEVFSPAKQDDFPDLLYTISYSTLYDKMLDTYLMQNAVCLLKVPSRSLSCFLRHV